METIQSHSNRNPFAKYEKLLQETKTKINPIHEIVNTFYKLKGMENREKKEYTGRYSYGKLAKEARTLYDSCDRKLEDSLWALDQMKYKAQKGRFDWSIITCLKHRLNDN